MTHALRAQDMARHVYTSRTNLNDELRVGGVRLNMHVHVVGVSSFPKRAENNGDCCDSTASHSYNRDR